MRLEGKIILVTGAASGIGAAMVRRFAAEGAQVFAADVDRALGETVAASCSARFVALDVASEAQWAEAMAQVRAAHGRLDGLVNNAGIVSNQPIDMTDLDSWNRIVGVNLTGPMLGCRAAIEAMRANPVPGGSIVNVASTVSVLGLPDDAAYTASKAGVMGLTRSIAAQCARMGWNIRVNNLHPGATLTAILQGHIDADPSFREKFDAMSPLGRMARPDEIAALALFLLSDEASYCTGGSYMADGGLTATHPTM